MVDSKNDCVLLPEVSIEVAIDNEVHDTVNNKQQVVDSCRAYKPDGRKKSISTCDNFITIKHLV